jgi:hypothetical protein
MSRGLQSYRSGPWSDAALARLRSIANSYGWPAFMQLLAMIAAVGTVFAAAYMYLTYLREPEQPEFQVRAVVFFRAKPLWVWFFSCGSMRARRRLGVKQRCVGSDCGRQVCEQCGIVADTQPGAAARDIVRVGLPLGIVYFYLPCSRSQYGLATNNMYYRHWRNQNSSLLLHLYCAGPDGQRTAAIITWEIRF